MDPAEQALLAEAEQIIRDQLELEQLAEVLKMHDTVRRLLAALEARIEELVPSWKDWP